MAIPAVSMEDAQQFSCSTHLSKEALTRIGKFGPGPLALQFLTHMHNETFGNAGWHRKQNRSELSCEYDLALWADRLGCDKSNLKRTFDHLLEAKAIIFLPVKAKGQDYNLPGRGLITWQLAEEWLPYHRRVAKRKQSNVVAFPTRKTQPCSLVVEPQNHETQPCSLDKTSVTQPCQVAIEHVTQPCPLASETRQEEARADAVIKSITEERVTEEKDKRANASLIKQGELLPIAPKQKASKPANGSKKGYVIDALYYKAVEIFGKPLGGQKDYWLKTVLPRLREDGITPEQLDQAAKAYKERCKGYTFSMKAIFNNLSTLLQPQATPAKQEKPQQTMTTSYHYGVVSYFPQGGN